MNVRSEKSHSPIWSRNNVNFLISSKTLIRTSASSRTIRSCKEINTGRGSVPQGSSLSTICRKKSTRTRLIEIEPILTLVQPIAKNGASVLLISQISLGRQLPKDTRVKNRRSPGTNNFMISPSSTQSTWQMKKSHLDTMASMKG